MPEYQNRPVTANAVVIKHGKILLIKRGREPVKDFWANAGGFVQIDENTETAALRELLEETKVVGKIVKLIGVYSAPARDPKRHTVNVAYLVEVVDDSNMVQGDDAAEVKWFPLNNLPPLAFDHSEQISDALTKL